MINISDVKLTDIQHCLLVELHLRKSVEHSQLSSGEKRSAPIMQARGLIYRNGNKWTITEEGHGVANRLIQKQGFYQ